jgi:hypothetical protein
MKKNLSFKSFEKWTKKNKWTSIILLFVFICGTLFSAVGYVNKIWVFSKEVVGYRIPIMFKVSEIESVKQAV